MKSFKAKVRYYGFTLIELMVAMAIASSVILMVLYLNRNSAMWWKNTKDTVYTATISRTALQTVTQDLESFQMKPGDNSYEWLYAGKDKDAAKGKSSSNKKKKGSKKPAGLSHIPDSARMIFFSCSPSRNPAVSHDVNDRGAYRDELASRGTGLEGGDSGYKGDVCAICYCLEYKDNIRVSQSESNLFPVFSLFRQVLPPGETYQESLCTNSLEPLFANDENPELICDNVVELNLSFNIEYSPNAGKKKNERLLETVTVISSNGQAKEVSVRGDSVLVDGKELKNARIVSANINVSVLTEEGAEMVNRLREGDAKLIRRLENTDGLVDFFKEYTRQFSRAVTLPQPY